MGNFPILKKEKSPGNEVGLLFYIFYYAVRFNNYWELRNQRTSPFIHWQTETNCMVEFFFLLLSVLLLFVRVCYHSFSHFMLVSILLSISHPYYT